MSAGNKSGGLKGKISSGNKDGPSPSSMGKTKVDSSAVKKKLVSSSIKQSADPIKQKSVTNFVSSTEVKTNSTAGSTKTVTGSIKTVTKTVSKTKEKKVFSSPGQKFDIPEEREPLRIFYESLSQQIPSSEMAEFWLMEHGLLLPDRAKKALEKKQRKQKEIRTGTPVKYQTPSMSIKAENSKKQQQQQQVVKNGGEVKAKRRVLDDSDDDCDFISTKKRKW